MAQTEEQIKAPKKELGDEEIENLSDAEFKTLALRMLTEIVEYVHKIEKKVKSIQSEIKENIQGTNRLNIQGNQDSINDLEQKKEINIQPEQNKETRMQKNEERLRNLWDNFECFNIRIIGVPEGEEQEQEAENLFENIMKKNFPNQVKERDFQEVQEAQSPKEIRPKEEHTKTHHH